MSNTDKDRPFWVQNLEHGQIDHDHTSGKCIISDDQRERWNSWRHHWAHCKKRVVVEYFCTKEEPNKNWRTQTCWTYQYENPEAPFGYRNLRWVGCAGHTRTETDWSIRCVCDDRPPAPTCFPSWKAGKYYTHGGVPTWFVREVYHRPQRAKTKSKLNKMAREYNENYDIEDYDIENRQGRNSARWLWW